MTTRTTIGGRQKPRDMFSTLLKPMAEVEAAAKNCGCGGGCRAKALTRLNREGMEACAAGDFETAARLLSEGIETARRGRISMYEAKLRNNLGLVYLLAERFDEAAGEFSRALSMVGDKLGRDNSLYRRIEDNLARAVVKAA